MLSKEPIVIWSPDDEEEERLRCENDQLRTELTRTSKRIQTLERLANLYLVVAEHLQSDKHQDPKIREPESCRRSEHGGRIRGSSCRHEVYERQLVKRGAERSETERKKRKAPANARA